MITLRRETRIEEIRATALLLGETLGLKIDRERLQSLRVDGPDDRRVSPSLTGHPFFSETHYDPRHELSCFMQVSDRHASR